MDKKSEIDVPSAACRLTIHAEFAGGKSVVRIMILLKGCALYAANVHNLNMN